MVQTLRNGIEIQWGETSCMLRPTIGALCAIEKHSHLTIIQLITLFYTVHLPMPTLRLMVREGAKAAGDIPHDDMLSDDQALRTLVPQLRCFLLQGIGYADPDATSFDAKALQSLRQPDWDDMFMTYVGIMERQATEFWQITLTEYALAVEGFCLRHDIDSLSSAAPATSQDLAEMLQQYPDKQANEADVV